jgi:hypothetical protein
MALSGEGRAEAKVGIGEMELVDTESRDRKLS